MHDDSTPSAASGSDAHWDVRSRLQDPVDMLALALGQWQDGRPPPFARRAASTAVGQIDHMLAELHQMRARLISEIRASDDAHAARVDAMLAGRAAP